MIEVKTKSDDEQYLLFMKSPTAAKPAGNCSFSQRDASTFTSSCLDSSLKALGLTNSTIRSSKKKFDGGVYLSV